MARTTYLHADRIVPVTGAAPIDDGIVAIEDGAIIAAGPNAQFPDLDPAAVRHFPGATLLPGFIDAHAHLSLPADRRNYEQMMLDPDEMQTLIAARNMRLHLESGVTTLRDNGARNRVTFVLREAVRRGYFVGPRLLLSGRAVTHSSGHFHFNNEVADGVEAIRRSVRRLVADGADHIKIMASGGDTAGNIPYRASYTTDELRAAVDAAHDLGRLTTAHCRARDAMERALEAGLDCIEHAEFLVAPDKVNHHLGSGRVPPGRFDYDPALAERLLKRGTFISFTYQTDGWDSIVELRGKGALSIEEAARLGELERYFEAKHALFGRLLRDGYLPRLVVSSDAGPADAQFGHMYFNLELAVLGGMTPSQAIDSVTRIAAEAVGLGDLIGTIEPGKRADLVVVRGDPLADIRATADVQAVFRDGVQVAGAAPPAALSPH